MTFSSTKVAVIGASGYMGEELVRLLLQHPYADLVAVTSRQYAGQPLRAVFPRFYEAPLCFSTPSVDEIAAQVKVAFLALPHGLAAEYALPLIERGIRVIDVSADFRLDDAAVYKQYYKADHPAPEWLAKAVYGQPERYRAQIKDCPLIACPGCYPTSILLPGTALLKAGLVSPEHIIVSSMSGVTGAGRKADLPFLFAECNESLRPYNVIAHRHLSEIEQELAKAAGLPSVTISFVPHLVPVNRGIHTTIFLDAARPGITAEDVQAALKTAYAGEPFVRILAPGELADTKHVTFTNMCEIGYAVDPRTHRIVISSAEDNLTKGGSGQAVQCFNIAMGYPETAGLC